MHHFWLTMLSRVFQKLNFFFILSAHYFRAPGVVFESDSNLVFASELQEPVIVCLFYHLVIMNVRFSLFLVFFVIINENTIAAPPSQTLCKICVGTDGRRQQPSSAYCSRYGINSFLIFMWCSV